MGMDVYGDNADEEVGEYFRRNVWGWRPLWDYIKEVHGDLVEGVEGHTNDGDGLDETNSLKLSNRLKIDLSTGKVAKYVEDRNKAIAELPRIKCPLCNSTGIRSDAVGKEQMMPTRALSPDVAKQVGRTIGWCNACDGLGDKESWDASYYLEVIDIEEFAEFLTHCGGFQIC